MSNVLKGGLVIVGAVALSTLAINASDMFRGIEGSLPGLAIESTGPCGEGAVLTHTDKGSLCVDTYEASPGEACPVNDPQNEIDTQANVSATGCGAVSTLGARPWRFVSLTQAQQLCARSGKRLPTDGEWYINVVGMSDLSTCVVKNSGPKLTGESACATPAGIQDMIGNVWEWVDAEVTDGQFEGVTLPKSGYVALVNSDGVVLETSDQPSQDFGEDYAWTNDAGVRGMLRGGFYGAETDAGIFTINASVPLNFKAAGVGFRCVKDV